jgi:DNA-binding response OmpR family regulator
MEIKKYYKGIVIFISEICDEFVYNKVLKVADYCYTYLELFKLKIRLEYLEKKVGNLKTKIFKFKEFVFNFANNQLYKNSEPIKLTKAESEILKLLITNRNKYLSKEDIISMSSSIDSINSIKVLISNLRKLGIEIENVKSFGYKLKGTS